MDSSPPIGPLQPLAAHFAICRLEPQSPLPAWADRGELLNITYTEDELSIVCDQALLPKHFDGTVDRDWRALKVPGPLDFALTGIMARLTAPLAEAGISVFAISTFDTDYLLVKAKDFSAAQQLLADR